MTELFKDLGDALSPVRREAQQLHGIVERGQVMIEIHPNFKLGYIKEWNCIRIVRGEETIITIVVPENYSVKQFQEDAFKYHLLYNNL